MMSEAIIYVEKEDARVQTVRKQVIIDEELVAIHKERGSVDVDSVIERASEPENRLHAYFEWDDGIAADKYRRAQAYAMIMTCKMIAYLKEEKPPIEVKGTQVRKLISSYRGEGFNLRPEALKDKDKKKAFIAKKIGQLRSWVNSTVDIPELSTVREAISTMILKL